MQNPNIEERPVAKNGGNREKKGEPASTKYLGWRIFCGALVVALGLAAVVVSLHLVLDNFDVKETIPPVTAGVAAKGTTATASDTASVSASSAVAVLTPVMAGIIGLAGLYFGISATASARGRQAAAEETKAEAK